MDKGRMKRKEKGGEVEREGERERERVSE